MNLPHKFGKYELIKKIAQGGMAEVYLAKYHGERGFARDVAVKRILPAWSERKDFERMLIDEAQALVNLHHKNIVQVFELGRDGDSLFISMEYVDGFDLKYLFDILKQRGEVLPEKFICYIIVEILKALESAHKKLNIVHRDISPHNILISDDGEIKLTDFGIAKGLHRAEETTHHHLKGKYAYMSPEQARGEEIDKRTDLFSAGIIFYELLSGRRLFLSHSDYATIQNVTELILPEGWEMDVSLSVRQILKRALTKKREDRYASAAEFLRDLNAHILLKKFHTYESEFADFLELLLEREKKKETVLREDIKKTKIATNAIPHSKRRYLFGRVSVSALAIISLSTISGDTLINRVEALNETGQDSHVQLKVEAPVEPEMNSIDISGTAAAKNKIIKDKQREAIPEHGFLSVNVRPWGIVSVDGVLRGKESPVKNLKLNNGVYKVRVVYPPTSKTLVSSVDMKGGVSSCQADFSDNAKISCR